MDIIINDFASFCISIEYMWLMFAFLLAILVIRMDDTLTSVVPVKQCTEKSSLPVNEVNYNQSTAMLSWLVRCIYQSENSEEDCISP